MNESKGTSIEQLIKVMKRLRHPTEGCPWDREQTFSSVAPYTVEEAYEVEDAIARNDLDAIREELGDLLLQIVFHARIAEEAGHFDFDAVADSVTRKMIERHPHVFGEENQRTQEFHSEAWEEQKTQERQAKSGDSQRILSDVAASLPSLMRSGKLIKRAMRAGCDPTTPETVLEQLQEKIPKAPVSGLDNVVQKKDRENWFGETLFLISHLARQMKVDTERVLRESNRTFEKRFEQLENLQFKDHTGNKALSLEEWIGLYQSPMDTS